MFRFLTASLVAIALVFSPLPGFHSVGVGVQPVQASFVAKTVWRGAVLAALRYGTPILVRKAASYLKDPRVQAAVVGYIVREVAKNPALRANAAKLLAAADIPNIDALLNGGGLPGVTPPDVSFPAVPEFAPDVEFDQVAEALTNFDLILTNYLDVVGSQPPHMPPVFVPDPDVIIVENNREGGLFDFLFNPPDDGSYVFAGEYRGPELPRHLSNVRLAGTVYPLEIGDKVFPIPFNEHGFPVFDEYVKAEIQLPEFTGNRRSDGISATLALRNMGFDASVLANAEFSIGEIEAAIEAGAERIPGYTWHHHEF